MPDVAESPAEIALNILKDPLKAVALAERLVKLRDDIAAREQGLQERINELAYLMDAEQYVRTNEAECLAGKEDAERRVLDARRAEETARKLEAEAREDRAEAKKLRASAEQEQHVRDQKLKKALDEVESRSQAVQARATRLDGWGRQFWALANDLVTDLSKDVP